MLYFIVDPKTREVISAKENHSAAHHHAHQVYGKVEMRHDWKTLDAAEAIAASATKTLGRLYIATDSGPNVSPRFDVQEAPAIGDEVSYGFNGDYYPCGTITKISASLRRIETSDGSVFFRRKQSGSWLKGGMWSLVNGHVNERNPSF